MLDHKIGVTTATNLIERAIEMLHTIGETSSALRLRRTLAIIRHDVQPIDLDRTTKVALSLMRMALALMDTVGVGQPRGPLLLQEAIDVTRGARPLRPGDELDPDLIDALMGAKVHDLTVKPA